MSILFVNGSPNPNGNTVRLAAQLLAGKPHDTVEWTIERFAGLYRMRYEGMVTNAAEARAAAARV